MERKLTQNRGHFRGGGRSRPVEFKKGMTHIVYKKGEDAPKLFGQLIEAGELDTHITIRIKERAAKKKEAKPS